MQEDCRPLSNHKCFWNRGRPGLPSGTWLKVEQQRSTSLGSPWRGPSPISEGESPGRRGRSRGDTHTHPRAHSRATCTHLAGGCTGGHGGGCRPQSPSPAPAPSGRESSSRAPARAAHRRPVLTGTGRLPTRGDAGLGLQLLSTPAPGCSRRREGGASRAPRHTHHYGITVGHRSRHVLARCTEVHGSRPGGGGRWTRSAGAEPGAVSR
jgi:hypothetical protein